MLGPVPERQEGSRDDLVRVSNQLPLDDNLPLLVVLFVVLFDIAGAVEEQPGVSRHREQPVTLWRDLQRNERPRGCVVLLLLIFLTLVRGGDNAASHEVDGCCHRLARTEAPYSNQALLAGSREVDRIGGGAHGRLADESSRSRRVEADHSLSRLVHGQRGDALHGLEVPFVHDSVSGARDELIIASLGPNRHLDGGHRALVRLQNPNAFPLPERPRPHLAIL